METPRESVIPFFLRFRRSQRCFSNGCIRRTCTRFTDAAAARVRSHAPTLATTAGSASHDHHGGDLHRWIGQVFMSLARSESSGLGHRGDERAAATWHG
eukprot:3242457-Pyramimonas_sp.AAC.1